MDNEQKKDEQTVAGNDPNPSDRELERREFTPSEEQPVFDIDEADLVVAPPEPEPNVAEFTDADRKTLHEEPLVAGMPVAVDNITEDDLSAAERAAHSARTQANAAADAFRRGEFMHEAAVDPAADKDDRLIALLSYATQTLIPFVMPALVLMSESSKKRPFQRFHAVQSLALTIVMVVLAIFVGISTAIISLVPVIGWLVALVVGCLSPLAVLMAWFALVYYGYQAYQGKRFGIPGLSTFLKDQNWI